MSKIQCEEKQCPECLGLGSKSVWISDVPGTNTTNGRVVIRQCVRCAGKGKIYIWSVASTA